MCYNIRKKSPRRRAIPSRLNLYNSFKILRIARAILSNNRMKEKTFLTMLNLFSLFFLLLSNLPISFPPFLFFCFLTSFSINILYHDGASKSIVFPIFFRKFWYIEMI